MSQKKSSNGAITIADVPWVPESNDLERDKILESMIDHISDYGKQFPKVNVPALKSSVLVPVLEAPDPTKPSVTFDPEVQIRGFLKAFQQTAAFQSQFKILDDRTKAQIKTFVDQPDTWKETPIWKSTNEKGFILPEVNSNTCKVLTTSQSRSSPGFRLRQLLSRAFAKVAQPLALFAFKLSMQRAARRLQNSQTKKYAGGPDVFEDQEKMQKMTVYSNLPFGNWGQSVSNTPRYTFVPKTVLGIQNLVLYAKKNGLRVRCAGYRHSWSHTFSQDNQIFISLLPIIQVTRIPDPMSIQPNGHSVEPTELNRIELLPESPKIPAGKRWCRVGVATTNEDFRRWAVTNKQWALPVDVILVEVTIGGVNGPICHGAGAAHKTVSDYVRAIEYVDANGKHRTVSDPEHLRAAAGCFGLLGIVTHVTLELDEMTYAEMKPVKQTVFEAIPPLTKDDVPNALRDQQWKKLGDHDLKVWADNFADRAVNDYYSEWFWFTYQKKCWVNTWNTTKDPANVIDYPGPEDTFLQWVEGWIGGIITETKFFKAIPGAWQAQLLATLGMSYLPPVHGENHTPTIKTLLPDGLHFRRGIQNMRVRDTEFQIPVPNIPGTADPDWAVVQRAWWDAIKLVYELSHPPRPTGGFFQKVARVLRRPLSPNHGGGTTPMRLTLELRIMGGSNMHMAPQAGNQYTASIEVLTIPDSEYDGEWQDFMQRLITIWMAYTDRAGNKLNIRPHWAKEWEGLRMGAPGEQLDAREYLRTVSYPTAIRDFRATLADIGTQQDWRLQDLRDRFSNELWDQMVFRPES